MKTRFATLIPALTLILAPAVTPNIAIAQTGRTVTLNWTPSTSPGLTGTNVYRGPGACLTATTFTKLTATPVVLASTTYDDTSMPTYGKFCYYVTATAVGAESGPSNKTDADVQPKPPSGLTSVVPVAAYVKPGGTVQFVADAPAESWSIYPPLGTITAAGLYRAPFGIAGNNKKVTVQASSGISSAVATVTIRK